MKLTRTLAGIGLLALCLASCTPKNIDPTLDPMLIHTSVAETMSAEITQTAAAMPSATPIPPTEPPPPPPTEAPPTVAPVMVLPTAELPTSAPEDDKPKDRGILVSQIPVDGQRFNPSSAFDAIITFQNVGETTWNTLYSIRYLGYGPDFNGQHTYTLDSQYSNNQTVGTGETVSVTLPNLVAPDGYDMSHISHWCLYNNRDSEGLPPQCFLPFTIDIFVGPEK